MKAHKGRELYVENDAETWYMMQALLDQYGYETVIASSVADALELLKTNSIALLILDNWFEQSSGVELCEQIRKFDQSTPILFYSSAGYEADIKAGIDAGAQGYLVKPDIEHLQETMARVSYEAKVKRLAS